MKVEWVKQQLLRGSKVAAAAAATSAARRPPRSAAVAKTRSGAFLIAERMEPLGCSCVLITPQRAVETPSATVPVAAVSAPQTSSQRSAMSPRTRHRVTLTGITPGTVLRMRPSVLEWVRRTRQLPAASEQYSVLMRRGRRVVGHGETTAAASQLPRLPCGRASTNACAQCPWMALQSDGGSSSSAAKQRAWHAAVSGAVRNRWAADLGTTRAGKRSAERLPLSFEQVMRRVSFLEPFAVDVPLNQLQGLQLFCVHKQSSGSPSGTEHAATLPLSAPATPLAATEGADNASVRLVREGTSFREVAEPKTSLQSARQRPTLQDECLLETLEQKRLLPFLQRWMNQLPTSVQSRLEGVFITQPTTPTTASGTPSRNTAAAAAFIKTSLQVIVVVQQNTDVLGFCNPLCGMAHPPDLLSTEEQQLVEAVTSSAPLLADIEVLVCIRGRLSVAHATAKGNAKAPLPEAMVHRLYPRLDRTWSLSQLSVIEEQSSIAGIRSKVAAGCLPVRCWCDPLQRWLQVRLPPYHVALSMVPELTLGANSAASSKTTLWRPSTAASPARAPPSSPGEVGSNGSVLPWIPTFWRHACALDACCSLFLSLLLEASEEAAARAGGVVSGEAAVLPSCTPLVSMHCPPSSKGAARSLLAQEAGAIAGQRLLDDALKGLMEQMQWSAAAATTPPEGSPATRAGPRAPAAQPSVHVFSVSELEEAAVTAARVYHAARAASPATDALHLCLYTCTATMKADRLSTVVGSLLHDGAAANKTVHVSTGVVDVDPLSSAFVAYARINVTAPQRGK